MRLAALPLVLALSLGACPGPSDPSTGECNVDEECRSGEVCARDNLCWRTSEVRFVKATWTVNGQPASATACARYPDLYIEFRGTSVQSLGFSPVPCENGQFSVDKLPLGFTRVELGVDNGGPWRATSIGAAGTAALDLSFF